MQVKKFEAPSMKEALELVKAELGPEAIILGAKDLKSGVRGRNSVSVEVTAAVSELQLNKRKLAEAKLTQPAKDTLRGQTARQQKEFINKVFERRMNAAAERVQIDGLEMSQRTRRVSGNAPASRPRTGPTQTRYIDIDSQDTAQDTSYTRASARQGSAKQAGTQTPASTNQQRATAPAPRPRPVSAGPQAVASSGEIDLLKKEIENLQKFISDMAKSSKPTTTLHPGAELGISYDLTDAYQKLIQTGIAPVTVVQMMETTQKSMSPDQMKRKHLVEAFLTRELLGRIKTQERPFPRGTHFFVGPSGQGKTSTLVKIASRMISERRETIAILTTDTRKVGAVDQLRIYSQIMNVPFGVLRSAADWEEIQHQLRGVDCILVDTGGTALKDLEDLESLRQFLPRHNDVNVHYVASATQREQESAETIRRFRALNPTDIIFTNLDESARYGGLINLSQEAGCPIVGLSTGRTIPDDFEWANRERILDLVLKISTSKPLAGSKA